MAVKKTQKIEQGPVEIMTITRETINVCILGRTPLVCNAMSEKVKQGLLSPTKKTAADKQANQKHNPIQEYRDSVYRAPTTAEGPTRIVVPSVSFKAAMCSAATDIPGAIKAQMGRLSYVEGEYVSIFGVPKLMCTIVRMADMARTPDVRTRAILPRWACTLAISYVVPLLKQQIVLNLMAAAGMIRGVGDGRIEKGKLDFGQFEIVSVDNPDFVEIVANGGREVQDAALESPEYYDEESERLVEWWKVESARRGFKAVA